VPLVSNRRQVRRHAFVHPASSVNCVRTVLRSIVSMVAFAVPLRIRTLRGTKRKKITTKTVLIRIVSSSVPVHPDSPVSAANVHSAIPTAFRAHAQ